MIYTHINPLGKFMGFAPQKYYLHLLIPVVGNEK
jgi:hypothetical protein